MSGSKIENVLNSLQTLTPVEQEKILKRYLNDKKTENTLDNQKFESTFDSKTIKSTEHKPTYAEVVAGKVFRSLTPEPRESQTTMSKHGLNSPETPYKGGSRKV